MKLTAGTFGLGLALCLPGMGATYTGGDCDGALLTHRWSFNGNYSDSVGGATASVSGAVANDGHAATTTGGTDGSGYINLGTNLLPADGSAATIEIWGAVNRLYQWSRVFDVGSDKNNYLMLAWSYQTNASKDRCEIKKNGNALLSIDDTLFGYTLGTEYHLSMTVEPRSDGKADLRWVRRDARTGAILKQGSGTTSASWSLADIASGSFYLGHSFYYPSDYNANATYNEVRIWKAKLSDAQLAWSARLGADTLPTAAAAGADTATITATAGAGGKVAIDGAAAVLAGNTTVPKNQLVTLTATPDADCYFVAWTGDLDAIQSGSASDATITVYAARAASLTATFRGDITTQWSGAGNNDLWSNAANWENSLRPVDYAKVVFNGGIRTTNQNDAVSALDKLTFGTSAAAHLITGNGVELPVVENFSSATQTIDLPVTAPTLDIAGSGTTVFGKSVTSTTQNLADNATAVFQGGIDAGSAVDVINGGTVYLNGTSRAQSLDLQRNGTTLTFAGSGTTFTATYDLAGANLIGTDESTTINIDGGTLNLGRNLLTDNSGGTGGGATRAGGNGTVNQTGGSVKVAQYLVIGRDHVGTYNLSGGTLEQTQERADYVKIGEVAGSSGTFNVSGDAYFKAGWNVQPGVYGTGELNVSGGEFEFPYFMSIGRYASGVGTVNVTGGRIVQTQGGTDAGIIVGELGKGTLNISGHGIVDAAGVISFAHSSASAEGHLNLTDGGTLMTSKIVNYYPASRSSMHVDGGRLVAKGTSTVLDDFIGLANFSVGPKGMTFDTGDNTVMLGSAFNLGAVEGPITKTGSGTLYLTADASVPVKVDKGTLVGTPSAASGAIEENLVAHLIHRWSFNGDLTDSVGGLDATGIGTSFADNAIRTTGGGKSVSYVSLNPNALPKDRPFTIEIFATPRAVHSWSRIFSFGKGAPNSDHTENMFMSWTRGTNQNQDQVRFRYNGGGNAISVDDTLQPFTLNTKWHIALTYVPNMTGDGKGRFFWSKTDLNGGSHRESSATTSVPMDLATWGMDGFYLGRSYWTADLDASADYDEVRIWDTALSSEQLVANATLGPDMLPQTELLHRWSFNGDLRDSIGGTSAQLVDAVELTDKVATTTGGTTGSGYINLGTNMLPTDGSPVTIEIWATPHSRPHWSRVFDIGPDKQNYLTHAWSYQTATDRDLVEIKKNNTALISNQYTLFGYELNVEQHYAFTITPRSDGKATVTWARRDARTGAIVKQGSATTSAAWSIADIASGPFYLGHSQYYPTDHNANASYDEVRVWKGVLNDAQLARSATVGPDVLPTEGARLASVEIAAGAVFATQNGEVAAGKLSGAGTVSGSDTLTVAETLDIAGEAIGTMTLNGKMAVKGNWLLDLDEDGGCDCLTGTGTLDLSRATITVRDPSKFRGGSRLLATVGEVTGAESARVVNAAGAKLICENGRLSLVRDGVYLILW